MTLSQLAVALLAVLVLGSFALTLDWPALIASVDAAAVEAARFFLPVWEPLEQIIPR